VSDATAERLDGIVQGYRAAAVLFAAQRVGVFAALAEGPWSAGELAARLGADRRGMRILLDACAALGLLDKEGERYAAGEVAREHLLPGAPRSQAASVRHAARLYARWGHLADAVVEGRPVAEEAIDARLGHDEVEFARAMADVGRRSARVTVEALDLGGVASALDLGGGPAIYAVEMARSSEGLVVTVLDRPGTLAEARRNVEAAGLADRVRLLPGDALADPLGGPYDLVFTSNLVHIYPPEANRRLIARAAAALSPGGRLAVKDFLLDPDRTAPAGGALFAVNMLVATEGGDSYTVEEVAGWAEEAGLTVEGVRDLTAQSRLLVARKPAGRS
jgi:predicted O-methyltransferase YrrM